MKLINKFIKSKEDLILGLFGLSLFLILWAEAAQLKWIAPIFISSPGEVTKEVIIMFQNRTIFPHLAISLTEFLLGFSAAAFLGIIFGILIGWYKKLRGLTSLLIFALYSTPTIAILPLIVIWLGFDIWTKVLIVFLSAFFPILINTMSGVENLNSDLIRLGRSFGANDLAIFRTIALPGSLPFIVTGLRLAVTRGMIGMLIGEFYVSNKGLGYLITSYGSSFQTSKFLAVVLLVVLIGITLTQTIGLLENKLKSWKISRD
ncbi:MAG: ABC transporter permease [Microgenomates group bacterium]|jgi:NitT/TauT family transport system permease protein